MSGQRWGDDAPRSNADARGRILDAAESCIDRFGLTKTTVEDIAREANVSRATVYRYFGTRDELVLEVFVRDLERSRERELDEFFVDAEDAAAFAEAVVDASCYLLAAIRRSPKLREMLSRDSAGVGATVANASAALFTGWIADVSPYLLDAQEAGLLRRDVPAADMAEWILRLILSLLLVEGPSHHSEAEERALLRTFLAPGLVPQAVPADG